MSGQILSRRAAIIAAATLPAVAAVPALATLASAADPAETIGRAFVAAEDRWLALALRWGELETTMVAAGYRVGCEAGQAAFGMDVIQDQKAEAQEEAEEHLEALLDTPAKTTAGLLAKAEALCVAAHFGYPEAAELGDSLRDDLRRGGA